MAKGRSSPLSLVLHLSVQERLLYVAQIHVSRVLLELQRHDIFDILLVAPDASIDALLEGERRCHYTHS